VLHLDFTRKPAIRESIHGSQSSLLQILVKYVAESVIKQHISCQCTLSILSL